MLQISNLHFSYEQADSAQSTLNGIDLSIKAGESVALIGPNGAGKTTFARCLNGLLLPTQGDVHINGESTKDRTQIIGIRQQVGIVFQNPENQIVSATVEREIAFGLENLGIERNRMHAIVDNMLDKFNLTQYRQHAPHLLSGGEMQRLALAAVMAMSPQIVVFDEPTSLLDPANQQLVLSLIADLHRQPVKDDHAPISTILITQNPEEALHCKRLLVLNQGQILFDDKPDVVFRKTDELKNVGLQVPAEYEIADYLKKCGQEKSTFDPTDFQRYYAESLK